LLFFDELLIYIVVITERQKPARLAVTVSIEYFRLRSKGKIDFHLSSATICEDLGTTPEPAEIQANRNKTMLTLDKDNPEVLFDVFEAVYFACFQTSRITGILSESPLNEAIALIKSYIPKDELKYSSGRPGDGSGRVSKQIKEMLDCLDILGREISKYARQPPVTATMYSLNRAFAGLIATCEFVFRRWNSFEKEGVQQPLG
jgi:hypothetical protein